MAVRQSVGTRKNHWLVPLLGSVPSLAMAIVPQTLERLALNSLLTGALVAIEVTEVPLNNITATLDNKFGYAAVYKGLILSSTINIA